jgi:hypothetical protein
MDSIMNNKYAIASIGFLLGVYTGVNNPEILSSMTSNSDMIIIIGGIGIIYAAYKNKLEGFVNTLKENFENFVNSIKHVKSSQAKLDAKCQNEYDNDLDSDKIKETVKYKEYKMMKKGDPKSACSKLE